ncbi:MAG TPA: HEAT repeat domain-containing protein, partial [Anaerolineaceae bacterium]|nr:HEAT repeat domain-containing protein [Anaerolineaceae bacterium]
RLPDGELREQVIERLCSALLDVHGMVRASAARALDACNWQPGRDEIAASYWVTKRLWQMCVAIGPAAARPLALALTEWDWTARRGAAEALGRIGGSCAVSALMGALNDEIPAVAEAAALALGRLGDPVAAPALLDHLDGLAEFGVRALGQIAEKANPATVSVVFLQPLETLLSAEETNPRVNAVNGLAAVGSRRGETSLQRQVVQMLSARIDDPDAQVRRSVLRGIEAIGAHAQEDGLRGEICALQLRAGNDPDEKVRQAAVNGIGHIGRRIGDLSIRHQLADEIRATFDAPDEQVWAILADLSMPEVVPGLEG